MSNKTQLTVKTNLLEAELILAHGGSQKEVREKFGDTLGQKLFCILALNKRFPASNIVHRMTNVAPEDPTYIHFAHVRGPDLPRLVLRSDPDALKAQNTKERTCGRNEILPLHQKDLDDYLCPVRCNEPKIMSKQNIHALAENAPISIIKDTARAILQNNVDLLNKYFAHAEAMNKVAEAFSNK